MKRLDLTDLTFIIPFRCDSQDRLENIELVVNYLTHNFDTTIRIMESSPVSILGNHPAIVKMGQERVSNIHYTWVQSDSLSFHRTKILNNMLEEVTTKFVANYDTDVLFPIQSYIDAIQALRNGEAFVFPYLGKFFDIPRKFISEIKDKMEVNWIDLSQCGVNHPSSVGGAMFMNTEVYKKLGGECEAMRSWGYEDNFRVNLFQKNGYNIVRVGTDLYHLEHWRGENSGPQHESYNDNASHFYNTTNMSREELMNFVNSYNRFRSN